MFSRYNLITTQHGRAGPPSYEIDVEQVTLLRGYHLKCLAYIEQHYGK